MLLSYYKRPLFIFLVLYFLIYFFYFKFFSKNIENGVANIADRKLLFCGYLKTYPEYTRGRIRFEFLSDLPSKNERFIVYLKKFDNLPLSYMDYVCFKGIAKKPNSFSLPGNFNWRGYLANKGIFLEIRADEVIKIRKAGFPYNIASKIRDRIKIFLNKNFEDTDENGVLNGIVLGEKKKISEKLKSKFQDSGSIHLLVASGSNVGFLMGMFSFFFIKILRIYRRKALVLGLGLTAFYVIAAGLDPPLTRAYTMTIFGTFFLIIERKTDLFQILILSAFLILLISPHSIFDPGFQMSFIAVYGIIIGVSLWNRYLKVKNTFLLYLIRLFFVTAFAQIALFPLLLTYFHKFSLISFISNMCLVPFSALLMYLVFFSVFLEKINFLFFILIYLLRLTIKVFIKLVYFFGSFKYSAIYLPNFNFWGYLFLVIFLFLLLHYPLFGLKNRRVFISLISAFILFVFSFFIPSRDFSVYFFSYKGVKSGVISVSGDLIVLNPCDEKIINTILSKGYKKVKAIIITDRLGYNKEIIDEMAKSLKVESIYAPLWIVTDKNQNVLKLWPGESKENKDFSIKLIWSDFKEKGCSGDRGKIKYIIRRKYLI